MKRSIDQLLNKIDFRFENEELFVAALTHRSAGQNNNERLEFLGDAILGMVIAAELYKRFPDASEGELSRLRASLVRGETLAEIARDLEIGALLHLGPGELKSGGYRRDSILADAFEAILGAIYLDSDFETCKRVLLSLFANRLNNISPATIQKDPKTQLQEYLQSRQIALPDYTVIDVTGEAHAQIFTVECNVAGIEAATATGSSRRKAEQAAAEKTLIMLTHD